MNNNMLKKLLIPILIVLILLGVIFYKKINKTENLSSYNITDIYDKNNIMPVVILGSGPAGQSAGIYACRAGFKTLIIEGSKPGGQLTETSYVENWPGEKKVLGSDLMQKLKEQNEKLGVSFLADDVSKIDFSKWPFELITSEGIKLNALSVIIATGSSPRKLNIPGEKEYWGRGVTTCAICDAPFYKDKNVIVVGGGDSAAEQVLQLSPHVKHINMLVRKDKFRASAAMQERIKEIKNLTVLYNKELKNIFGNQEHVNAVEIYDNKTKTTNKINIDGVFLAIGHIPNTALFKDQLDMDGAGYLKVSCPSQKTSVAGVFAAGDVEDHIYMQAGIASGAGIKAALDAGNFLHNIGYNSTVAQKIENKLYEPEISGPSVVSSIKTMAELNKLIKSKKPVILDFWAHHCPSCLQMMPAFEYLAKKFEDKMSFVKIDIDEAEKDLIEKLYVLKVPTFIVYKEGQIVARFSEFMTKSQMTNFVKKFI